jgi:hypothetical protein
MNGNPGIFTPVFVLIGLTIIVWVYMYAKRIPFINNNFDKDEAITPAELARRSPPEVSNPSDNLKNLFEVPVLFYFISVYLFITAQVDSIYIMAAWLFVILRIAHSLVHCTINIVMLRFTLYLLSSLTVFFMIIRAGLALI